MQRQRFQPLGRVMILCLLIVLIITACNTGNGENGLFGANPTALDEESAQEIATKFLTAWQNKDYGAMYDLISPNARNAYTEERFTNIYTSMDEDLLKIDKISYQIEDVSLQGTTAIVDYSLTLETQLIGSFTDPSATDPLGEGIEPRLMRLIGTSDGWRVAWSRSDIFPGWTANSQLLADKTSPIRGNIYDRNGNVLVETNGIAVQLYVIKNEMSTVDRCYAVLAEVLHRDVNRLADDYLGWAAETSFLAGEISRDTFNAYQNQLIAECNVDPEPPVRTTRFYYDNAAPHLIGYVGQIPLERQAEFELKGYPADALVGLDGVEAAFENELAGTVGIRLVIRSGTGTLIRAIAERKPKPGQNVYLTLDRDLQLELQYLLSNAYTEGVATWSLDSPGASAVVMDINTGEILAMASYPDFDPSVFNPNTQYYSPSDIIGSYRNDPRRPLFNRATQSRLPLGSVFKIFSTVAGLDSGVWPLDKVINCTGQWDGVPFGDRLRTDWKPEGHGPLNMQQALIASCNPYFWTLGLAMNTADPSILPSYARQFGFGSSPPLQGIGTDAGAIIGPDNIGSILGEIWSNSNALNMVIGQQVVEVNPLQVVRALAAVANGGTLYRPLVVEKVQEPGQEPSATYEPQGQQLDISADVLRDVREAMCEVTVNEPIGTATYIFQDWYLEIGNAVKICAKTGTAESGQQRPHAWFASFAPADNPQIAMIVVAENSCEGSEVAAPITRRFMETYFNLESYFENGTFGWPPLWYTGCTPIGPDVAGP